MKIIPRIGFDEIKFGFSREKVRELLGKPTSTSKVDFPDGASTESWIYENLEIELNFDSDLEYRLVRINFYSILSKIEGHEVIGIDEAKLQEIFPQIFLDEDLSDTGKNYEWVEKEISFWVTEGFVNNFTLFVPLNEAGTKIMWPE